MNDAIRWMTEAANEGDVDAQWYLAIIYYDGYEEIPVNQREGIRWLTKASDQGHAEAKVFLGDIHCVEEDIDKAIVLYKEAAALGNKEAIEALREFNALPKKRGCYIATCVYGSYYCREVFILRQFRDKKLSKSYLGEIFINAYYYISPKIVEKYGTDRYFLLLSRLILNGIVKLCQKKLNRKY
jgi:TPR repeat protein